MAVKQQPIAAAQDPMRAIKRLPLNPAKTSWNARHPLTPLVQKALAQQSKCRSRSTR
jgi:hypothetical protein